MQKLQKNLDPPINLQNGIKKLQSYVLNSSKSFHYNEEIDYGEQDIQSFLVVDKPYPLSERQYVVAVSFSVGPL